jgi:hypothetical protein
MPTTEATAIDKTTEVGKKQAAAKKRNAIAVANLTMSFTTDRTMAIIYKSKSTSWPNGLAHEITVALKNNYQPQDTMTRVELRHQLNQVTLKKNEDPATLFEQLSALENKCNTSSRKIDEEDLIAVVIDAAPDQYQSVLTNEQLRLKSRIKLEDLSKVVNALWRTHAGRGRVKQEDNELILLTHSMDSVSFARRKAIRLMSVPRRRVGRPPQMKEAQWAT